MPKTASLAILFRVTKPLSHTPCNLKVARLGATVKLFQKQSIVLSAG